MLYLSIICLSLFINRPNALLVFYLLDDHMEEVEVSSAEKEKAGKGNKDMDTEGGEKVDGHSLNSKEVSDSETLVSASLFSEPMFRCHS